MQLIRFLIIVLLLVSCTSNKIAKDDFSFIEKEAITKVADPMIAVTDTADSLQMIISKIKLFEEAAKEKLNEKDTIGAEIYVTRALEVINDLSENAISNISEDSSFQIISTSLLKLQKAVDLEFSNESKEDELAMDDLRAINEGVETFDEEVVYVEDNPIPYTMNKKVENVIKYFTTRGRKTYEVWLKRGSKYEALIKRILREENMPEDLYYLAMIESGFNTRARSWASAVGPWQFIRATGKAYGLNSSYWADDRRDMENSTRAAARHLKDLYNRFGTWYLAMAGYNCNPAKIARRVRQYNTTDYFKLKNIPRETRGYVPNFLAARIIGKNPEKYGFVKPEANPIEYDRIYTSEVVDLNHIAKASNTSYETVRDLNPALIKWLTPSDRDSMYLNVPLGTADIVKDYIKNLPDNQKQKLIRYRIKNGDSMSVISMRFGISMAQIRKLNKMRTNKLRAGKYLFIPVPDSKYHYTNKKYGTKKSTKKRVTKKPSSTKGKTKITYTVKSGDNLGAIAEVYQTRAQHIRNWNGLSFRQHIRVGQKLTLWINKDQKAINLASLNKLQTDQFNYHKIRSGDSLWEIAKKYNTSISNLKKLNKMSSNNIKVGSFIKVSTK